MADGGANIYSGMFSSSMFKVVKSETGLNEEFKEAIDEETAFNDIEAQLMLNEEFEEAAKVVDRKTANEMLRLARAQYAILSEKREVIGVHNIYEFHAQWYKSYREMQSHLLRISEDLPTNLERMDVIDDKITYWHEKRKSWFLVRWFALMRLFFLEKQRKKVVFFSAIVSQLMQMLTNRAYFANLALKMDKNKSFENTSLEKVMRAPENYSLTSIPRVEKPEDAKKDNGNVNEVYFTKISQQQDSDVSDLQSSNEKQNSKEVVIKKGNLFRFAPNIFGRLSSWFRQEVNMGGFVSATCFVIANFVSTISAAIGNFVSIIFGIFVRRGQRALVDSTFRQFIAGLVADYLGFNCIVHTDFANDEQYGLSVMMDNARGEKGFKVWLCLNEDEQKDYNNIIKNEGLKAHTCIIESAAQVERVLELSIVDFICYQPDRHAGNFFVEFIQEKDKPANWNLHGIDNDYCCLAKRANYSSLLRRKIPFLTSDLKEKISKINVDELCTRVSGFMRGERADLVMARFRERTDVLIQYANECPVYETEEKVMDYISEFIPSSMSGVYARKDNPISAIYCDQQLMWNKNEIPNSNTTDKELQLVL